MSNLLAILALSAAAAAAPSVSGRTNITSYGNVIVNTPVKGVAVTPLFGDTYHVYSTPVSNNQGLPINFTQAIENYWTIPGEFTTFTTPQYVKIIGENTIATIDRFTGQVTFADRAGHTILAETTGVDNSGDTKRIAFATPEGVHFYGGGERGHNLTLNGDSLTFYNRQNYSYGEGDPRISQMGISVPYLASDKGYSILFDDYNKASIVIGKDSIVYESATPRTLSYYFNKSPFGNLAGSAQNHSQLTGHQPLPPFWSLGYITSKYGYHNQAETLGAIDSLKRHGYPVDGIVLDLYWYGVEKDMGRLEWDTIQWPDHKGMLRQLKDQGVNLVAISQPYINKNGAIDNYNYLSERSMLAMDADGNTHDVTTWVGDAGMLDVSNPETREWLWNRYKSLTDEGIAGWWGDLGEPEVHPETIVHKNGETATQYHNVYGNEWSRLIYEGLRKDFPDMRPLLLMRGGTTGLQRYSVFPWTTDVARSWDGFRPQVKLMLSSGLSGIGYMSSDIGGFAVDPAHPTDPELYVRWLQMGTFTPMLRTHAQLKPEPYHYPQYEDITKRFIKMRYEWLPYNYTLAYQNAYLGLPLARPLNFWGSATGTDSEKYANVTDEYMWGDNVLVAPVFNPGERRRKVLLPPGEWYNWNNPTQKFKGDQTVTVEAPLNTLPLLIEAGSFIPQYTKPIENVTQYDPSELTVKYFPSWMKDETDTYELFMDDRQNPESLDSKQYQTTSFKAEMTDEGNLKIQISSEGEYPGMPEIVTYFLEVQDVKKCPQSVEIDGVKAQKYTNARQARQYGWSYDAAKHVVTLRLPHSNALTTTAVINNK